MIRFSANDVAQMAGRSCFNLGMDYFRAGRSVIKSYEMLSDDHMVISALTTGATNYIQAISVFERGGSVSLVGRCSCSVGADCKHVVSAALTFIQTYSQPFPSKRSSQSDADAWLSALAKALQPEEEKKSILIYRLSPSDLPGKMQLVFYRSRLLKNGGFGKQKRIEFHQLLSSFHSRDFLTDNDKDILQLFKALESKVVSTTYIEGELGRLLLQKMVESGNCYWNRNRNTPLSWGEPLTTEPVWREEKAGQYRLAFGLPRQYEILATSPLSYIDTKEHRAGRLEIEGVEPKQLALFLRAPLVSKEQLSRFAIKAIETLPSLPLPDAMDVKVLQVQPKAKIRLFAAQNRHRLQLTFLYESHELSGCSSQQSRVLKEGDEYLKVIRDQPLEKGCRSLIESMGFSADESGGNCTFIPAENGMPAIETWREFVQHHLPVLEEQGYEIEVDNSFLFRFEKGGEITLDVEQKKSWFDVEMAIDFKGEKLNLLAIVSRLLEQNADIEKLPDTLSFELEENHFITLDSAQFKPILKTLLALYKGERVEQLHINQYELHLLPETGPSVKMAGSAKAAVKRVRKELESFEGIEKLEHSHGLKATLRGYQQEGLNWLGFLERFGFGGILADDMGLGKTLQTLAFLQRLKEQGKLALPVLIVAPTSLLGNWKNEAKKFTPDLSLEVHHGLKRDKKIHLGFQSDIIITTYALLSRDLALFEQMAFSYFILDEAQNIKNLKSKVHSAAKKINAKNSVALTGTPMENHLGELWAIFDVVMPNFLGDYTTFKSFFQTPIEQEHSSRTPGDPAYQDSTLYAAPHQRKGGHRTAAQDHHDAQRRLRGAAGEALREHPHLDGEEGQGGDRREGAGPQPHHDPRRAAQTPPGLLRPASGAARRGAEGQRVRQAGDAARTGRRAPRRGQTHPHLLAVHLHAFHHRRGADAAGCPPRETDRQHPEPRKGDRAFHRRRSPRLPHLPQSRRRRSQPHPGRHGDPLRPVVEPRRRRPGHRPRLPHRPGQTGLCLQAHH